jgi:hypothetical protein
MERVRAHIQCSHVQAAECASAFWQVSVNNAHSFATSDPRDIALNDIYSTHHCIKQGAVQWLQSLPPTVHCDGKWLTLQAATPSATTSSGTDGTLGPYDSVAMVWTSSQGSAHRGKLHSAADEVLTTTIRYFSGFDAFLFDTTFGPAGCKNATVPDNEQVCSDVFVAQPFALQRTRNVSTRVVG